MPMQNVKTRSSISTRIVIRTFSERCPFALSRRESCCGDGDGDTIVAGDGSEGAIGCISVLVVDGLSDISVTPGVDDIHEAS